jgi:hypothetical protein
LAPEGSISDQEPIMFSHRQRPLGIGVFLSMTNAWHIPPALFCIAKSKPPLEASDDLPNSAPETMVLKQRRERHESPYDLQHAAVRRPNS